MLDEVQIIIVFAIVDNYLCCDCIDFNSKKIKLIHYTKCRFDFSITNQEYFFSKISQQGNLYGNLQNLSNDYIISRFSSFRIIINLLKYIINGFNQSGYSNQN
ncbi:unnamed protein product (macronuclear) [Paramecium tetraurelia]|uniref:Chromosome undetermined scaffold_224, whole genome shotgun sequence n=1 Tax=Paramecium tetraurelia TaxID=5888 RepID=A0CNX4_PARTE|nr:uncharacterized protein GSPATT00038760001 [Paramecium tetraurelia]XP_001454861.1 uncharacterized protein GSPATT00021107001 [Paramecium tetraurelia]CAK72491.1 unnamed protein product [Paramecium tetraurelia]CAK87464.1 unnamed protein product [Paramecium tetraurelia]|eukprot:XP_001439888.1 hypothetical protein (macronuclear) [Paramecium tetraurelia strain d4-2]